jgi:hypothetical protein
MISREQWMSGLRVPPLGRGRRKHPKLLRTLVVTTVAGITVFMIFMLVLHNRYAWWAYTFNSEQAAKTIAEDYLSSLKLAGDLSSQSDINQSGVAFVNVRGYRYLRTLGKERITVSYLAGRSDYSPPGLMKLLNFETYDRYLWKLEHAYERYALGHWPRQVVTRFYDDKYLFLYDLELTNQFGVKSLKQFIFEMQPTFLEDPIYSITAISESR